MDKILNVMEDVKQNITDNQYKMIMDSLMVLNCKFKFLQIWFFNVKYSL